mmetsp:Transcript_97189/g.275342  ORF Transcript_97189/g.275342 Transcript_97189/m.275342 type:complete len:221 (+) Transcript_97189:194-856(+)
MPKLANAWSTTSCNRLIAERMAERTHEKHVRAVESTRGLVDHKQPQQQPHLRSKPKTKKLQEDRAAEIQLENRILLQKMLSIDTKPSDLSVDSLSSQYIPPRSLNGGVQQRELEQITGQNFELLKRLQNAKPSISTGTEDDEVDRQALKFRLSQNSCRGRVARLQVPERSVSKLPKIDGSQSARLHHDNDWAELTNSELNNYLKQLESRKADTARALGNA